MVGIRTGLFMVDPLEYHFLHRASENCVAGKYPQFLSACCLATPEFFAILASAVDGFYRSNKRTAWFCRWDIIASGAAKIDARYGSGVSGERA